MKKIKLSVLTVLAMMALHTAYGQAQVAIGLKGGLNFASLSGTASASQAYSNRTGYHYGAYVLVKLTKIGIQPEVLLSKQGQKFTYNSQNYESNFDYISIPVMLKLYLAGGFNLQAGPQFSFLSSAKGDLINTANGSVATNQDMKSFVKSSDVTLAVGAGWDLPFGLNIAARYNIGLSDINKYTGATNPAIVSSMGTSQAKNQVIQVSVGYRIFKLGN